MCAHYYLLEFGLHKTIKLLPPSPFFTGHCQNALLSNKSTSFLYLFPDHSKHQLQFNRGWCKRASKKPAIFGCSSHCWFYVICGFVPKKTMPQIFLFVGKRKRWGTRHTRAVKMNVLPLVVTFVPHSSLLWLLGVSLTLPVITNFKSVWTSSLTATSKVWHGTIH